MKISIALCVVGIVLLSSFSGCKKRDDGLKKIDWSTSRLADIVDTDEDDDNDRRDQEKQDDYWCAV
jgi:hypothetical protein